MELPSTKKVLASLLASLFIFTHVIFCSAAETNFWSERKHAQVNSRKDATEKNQQLAALPQNFLSPVSSLESVLPTKIQSALLSERKNQTFPSHFRTLIESIPLQSSLVQEIYDSGNKKIPPVVLLQDVHLNAEAQTNIAHVLQSLIDTKQVAVVGVEGAFQAFDFSKLRAYSDKVSTRQSIQKLVDAKILAAPSFVGIASERLLPAFIGVDDRAHYDANVKAYLSTRQNESSVLKALDKTSAVIESKKGAIFSPKLRQFDVAYKSYHSGSMPMGNYLTALNSLGARTTDFTVQQFLEAQSIESSLDLKQVESQRRDVLVQLTNALTKSETSNLIALSMELKSGTITAADHYQVLKELCSKHGISFKSTPAFDNYIRYVLLSDGIQAQKIFTALENMEQELVSTLPTTQDQKSILDESQRIDLMKKLVKFELTPQEWEKYKLLCRGATSGRPNNVIHNLGGPMSRPTNFEDFYEQADIRSHKMLENLLGKNSSSSASKVLVAGGFHTSELTSILKRQKQSYVVVSPILTKVLDDNGSSYLSGFAREKTPLDRLFAGDKLFLNREDVNTTNGLAFMTALLTPAILDPKNRNPNVTQKGDNVSATINEMTIEATIGSQFGSDASFRLDDRTISLRRVTGLPWLIPALNFLRTLWGNILEPDAESHTLAFSIREHLEKSLLPGILAAAFILPITLISSAPSTSLKFLIAGLMLCSLISLVWAIPIGGLGLLASHVKDQHRKINLYSAPKDPELVGIAYKFYRTILAPLGYRLDMTDEENPNLGFSFMGDRLAEVDKINKVVSISPWLLRKTNFRAVDMLTKAMLIFVLMHELTRIQYPSPFLMKPFVLLRHPLLFINLFRSASSAKEIKIQKDFVTKLAAAWPLLQVPVNTIHLKQIRDEQFATFRETADTVSDPNFTYFIEQFLTYLSGDMSDEKAQARFLMEWARFNENTLVPNGFFGVLTLSESHSQVQRIQPICIIYRIEHRRFEKLAQEPHQSNSKGPDLNLEVLYLRKVSKTRNRLLSDSLFDKYRVFVDLDHVDLQVNYYEEARERNQYLKPDELGHINPAVLKQLDDLFMKQSRSLSRSDLTSKILRREVQVALVNAQLRLIKYYGEGLNKYWDTYRNFGLSADELHGWTIETREEHLKAIGRALAALSTGIPIESLWFVAKSEAYNKVTRYVVGRVGKSNKNFFMPSNQTETFLKMVALAANYRISLDAKELFQQIFNAPMIAITHDLPLEKSHKEIQGLIIKSFWMWVLTRFVDHTRAEKLLDTVVMRSVIVPLGEFVGLPGFMYLCYPFMPIQYAIVLGGLAFAAIHGLPTWGGRAPPTGTLRYKIAQFFDTQTFFEFSIRMVIATLLLSTAFYPGFSDIALQTLGDHTGLTKFLNWANEHPKSFVLIGHGFINLFLIGNFLSRFRLGPDSQSNQDWPLLKWYEPLLISEIPIEQEIALYAMYNNLGKYSKTGAELLPKIIAVGKTAGNPHVRAMALATAFKLAPENPDILAWVRSSLIQTADAKSILMVKYLWLTQIKNGRFIPNEQDALNLHHALSFDDERTHTVLGIILEIALSAKTVPSGLLTNPEFIRKLNALSISKDSGIVRLSMLLLRIADGAQINQSLRNEATGAIPSSTIRHMGEAPDIDAGDKTSLLASFAKAQKPIDYAEEQYYEGAQVLVWAARGSDFFKSFIDDVIQLIDRSGVKSIVLPIQIDTPLSKAVDDWAKKDDLSDEDKLAATKLIEVLKNKNITVIGGSLKSSATPEDIQALQIVEKIGAASKTGRVLVIGHYFDSGKVLARERDANEFDIPYSIGTILSAQKNILTRFIIEQSGIDVRQSQFFGANSLQSILDERNNKRNFGMNIKGTPLESMLLARDFSNTFGESFDGFVFRDHEDDGGDDDNSDPDSPSSPHPSTGRDIKNFHETVFSNNVVAAVEAAHSITLFNLNQWTGQEGNTRRATTISNPDQLKTYKRTMAAALGTLFSDTKAAPRQQYTFTFFSEQAPDPIRITAAIATALRENRAIKLAVPQSFETAYQAILNHYWPNTNQITLQVLEDNHPLILKARREGTLLQEELSDAIGAKIDGAFIIYDGFQLVGNGNIGIAFNLFLPPIEKLLNDRDILKIIEATMIAA